MNSLTVSLEAQRFGNKQAKDSRKFATSTLYILGCNFKFLILFQDAYKDLPELFYETLGITRLELLYVRFCSRYPLFWALFVSN